MFIAGIGEGWWTTMSGTASGEFGGGELLPSPFAPLSPAACATTSSFSFNSSTPFSFVSLDLAVSSLLSFSFCRRSSARRSALSNSSSSNPLWKHDPQHPRLPPQGVPFGSLPYGSIESERCWMFQHVSLNECQDKTD